MWATWTFTNNITHDKGDINPAHSMRMTRESLALLDLPRDHARILPGHGWRPPDDDWIKINVDGSIAVDARRGGVGGVARSHSSLMAAWCKPYSGITIIFAQLRGFEKVVLESDCMEIVNLYIKHHEPRSVMAPIMSEIREHFSSFKFCIIQHVSSTANFPAHLCAKHASTLDVTDCWIDSTPSFLVTSLLADSTGAVCVE